MHYLEENPDEAHEDIYRQKMLLEIPSMPIALKEGETEPSELFQKVQQTNYPPIFAKNTWTKGVLHKDVAMFYRPSESIGKFHHFVVIICN